MFTAKATHEQRIRVNKDEACTLPAHTRAVRVYQGGAWLSHRGEDFLLAEGEMLHLRAATYSPVVTALGQRILVLEIFT